MGSISNPSSAASAGLRWGGPWEPDASYTVGHLVSVGRMAYVCIVDSPASAPVLALADTFVRANQAGWGTSSHGEAWAVLGTDYDTNTIAGNLGLSACNGDGDTTLLGLGAGVLTTSSIEAVVRWRVPTSVNLYDGMTCKLHYPAEPGSTIDCDVHLNGTGHVDLPGTYDATSFTWAGGDADGTYWTRIRFAGGRVQVRVWPDGVSEPPEWNHTGHTNTFFEPGRVVLVNETANADTVTAFDQLDVYTLTPPPHESTENWELVAA